MATEDNFIVAIELGSSKVTGLVGRKQPDGAIQILASIQEPSASFIRKGRINNLNKMTSCATLIKDKLEKTLKKSISGCYVGVGGMGMHTVENTVVRHFPDKMLITNEVVDGIRDNNLQSQPGEREILEAVQQEYKLGAQTQLDPVGIQAEGIEGHFLNIVTNRRVREDIYTCFREAGLQVIDLPITFLALADQMLTGPEKRSGCVFVDMGAETTSVAVFKNNLLRHLAVIPLGGDNITRDIASLQIEHREAEQLKREYGKAYYEADDENHAPISLEDGRSVKYDDFSGLVQARLEEIIENVNEQIKCSKLDKSQLIGGLIITGGASRLKGMEEAFRKVTNIEKISFIKRVSTQLRLAQQLQNFNKEGDYNATIALIDKGEINCCGGELGAEAPTIFNREEEEKRRREQETRTAADAAEKQRLEEEKLRLEEERKQQEAEEAERQRRQEERERKKREAREKRSRFFGKIKKMIGSLVNDDREEE